MENCEIIQDNELTDRKNLKSANAKSSLDKRKSLQREFWTQLLTRSKNKTRLFENRSPGNEKHIGIGVGRSGLSYLYVVVSDRARVELYISREDVNWNKSVFDFLFDNRDEIEGRLGEKVEWDRLDDKQGSYIRYWVSGLGLKDKEKWPEIQDQLIDAMIKFEEAFRPYIKQIDR